MLHMIPAEAYSRPIVTQRLGPLTWHVAASPAAFRHIFRDHRAQYPKAPIMRRMLEPYLGDSVFMADGPGWTAQRTALGPAFRSQALRVLGTGMQRVAEDFAENLAPLADGRVEVAMSFQMRVLATQMMAETLFHELAKAAAQVPDAPDRDALGAYRSTLQGALNGQIQRIARPGLTDLLDLPHWLRPANWLKRAPTAVARTVILNLVRDRRAAGRTGPAKDMLDMLLDLTEPDGTPALTDRQIRDNLMTFIVTGSDTTAVALTWAVFMLSQRPDWAARLRAEADVALAHHSGADAVDRMPRTRAFLDEVLRLFPPAPLLVRKARADDTICGVPIRRGALIYCPIYALHRHMGTWDDPLAFRPERFLGGPAHEPYAYLPFGAGPRACIGAGFANLEACLTIASLVRRFDISLAPGWQVRPLMLLTLKPDGGLPVLLRRRATQAAEAPHQSAA